MTIGGFMPIPLAMMIPFMATQSLVMGESFGKAFQFGKRKISAMDNETFNKLTIEQVASEMFKSYQNILPDLKQSMRDSSQLQSDIIGQILSIPSETLADLFRLLAGQDRKGEAFVPEVSDPNKFNPPADQPQGTGPVEPPSTKPPGTSTPLTHKFSLRYKHPVDGREKSYVITRTESEHKKLLLNFRTNPTQSNYYAQGNLAIQLRINSIYATAFKNFYGYWA